MADTLKSDVTIFDLRCEYRLNPIGLDEPRPRLFWKLRANDPNACGVGQTAYQIQVATTTDLLNAEMGDLWDSGRVESKVSIHVEYAGQPIGSQTRVFWRVRVWDQAGKKSAWSEIAFWETALAEGGARSAFGGNWIGSKIVGTNEDSPKAPFLRRVFDLDRRIARARLYVTALGLYEAQINGKRISGDLFTPGWTDYRKRVQYQTYDVTDLLESGVNCLGFILGDGWYCGCVGWRGRQIYGDRPRLLCRLVVRFTDGTESVVTSDASWKTASGPILSSDNLQGEKYDARLEMPGWSTAKFDDAAWEPVVCFAEPGIEVVAWPGPYVRAQEQIKPIAEPTVKSVDDASSYIFDFGQNLTGRLRIRLSGPAGSAVTIRHAEVLNPDGTLYTKNLRKAAAMDVYILRGEEGESFEPRFTFHGFRYAELTCPATVKISREDVIAVVLHTEMARTGWFECSDPLVSRLAQNILWSQKGNFLDIPTDCPQRDERLGWMGDAQVFAGTATLNMDVAAFFTKWLRDVDCAQSAEGDIPPVVPDVVPQSPDGGPGWADAAVIVPWTIYRAYGDQRILKRHYEMMAKFLRRIASQAKDGVRCYEGFEGYRGYGDWLSIDADTPKELIGTAFLARCAEIMLDVAGLLERDDDWTEFFSIGRQARRAFRREFVGDNGQIVGDTQTAYVLALHFDLMPKRYRAAAVKWLIANIEECGDQLSTGFLGTPFLLSVLSEGEQADVAYELLMRKAWPSWLYAVTCGATTIWERWDGWTADKGFQDPGMNSFNHYALGAVGEWLFRNLGGIELELGWWEERRFDLRPLLGGGITHANAAVETLYGRLASEWSIEGGEFRWRVSLPANTRAILYMPRQAGRQVTINGRLAQRTSWSGAHEVPSGTHYLQATWEA